MTDRAGKIDKKNSPGNKTGPNSIHQNQKASPTKVVRTAYEKTNISNSSLSRGSVVRELKNEISTTKDTSVSKVMLKPSDSGSRQKPARQVPDCNTPKSSKSSIGYKSDVSRHESHATDTEEPSEVSEYGYYSDDDEFSITSMNTAVTVRSVRSNPSSRHGLLHDQDVYPKYHYPAKMPETDLTKVSQGEQDLDPDRNRIESIKSLLFEKPKTLPQHDSNTSLLTMIEDYFTSPLPPPSQPQAAVGEMPNDTDKLPLEDRIVTRKRAIGAGKDGVARTSSSPSSSSSKAPAARASATSTPSSIASSGKSSLTTTTTIKRRDAAAVRESAIPRATAQARKGQFHSQQSKMRNPVKELPTVPRKAAVSILQPESQPPSPPLMHQPPADADEGQADESCLVEPVAASFSSSPALAVAESGPSPSLPSRRPGLDMRPRSNACGLELISACSWALPDIHRAELAAEAYSRIIKALVAVDIDRSLFYIYKPTELHCVVATLSGIDAEDSFLCHAPKELQTEAMHIWKDVLSQALVFSSPVSSFTLRVLHVEVAETSCAFRLSDPSGTICLLREAARKAVADPRIRDFEDRYCLAPGTMASHVNIPDSNSIRSTFIRFKRRLPETVRARTVDAASRWQPLDIEVSSVRLVSEVASAYVQGGRDRSFLREWNLPPKLDRRTKLDGDENGKSSAAAAAVVSSRGLSLSDEVLNFMLKISARSRSRSCAEVMHKKTTTRDESEPAATRRRRGDSDAVVEYQTRHSGGSPTSSWSRQAWVGVTLTTVAMASLLLIGISRKK